MARWIAVAPMSRTRDRRCMTGDEHGFLPLSLKTLGAPCGITAFRSRRAPLAWLAHSAGPTMLLACSSGCSLKHCSTFVGRGYGWPFEHAVPAVAHPPSCSRFITPTVSFVRHAARYASGPRTSYPAHVVSFDTSVRLLPVCPCANRTFWSETAIQPVDPIEAPHSKLKTQT